MISLNVNNRAYNKPVSLHARVSEEVGKKKVKDVSHLQTALSPDFAGKLLTGKKPNTNARNLINGIEIF